MSPHIRQDMLRAMEKREEKYLEYRAQQLVKISARAFETIQIQSQIHEKYK